MTPAARRPGSRTTPPSSLRPGVLERIVAEADPALRPHAVEPPGPPRFEELALDPVRRFVLEAVYEGYLLHYGAPRAFAGMDPDLRLLAGDTLYALGLSRLAATGDLAAVAELSDLISLSARLHAEGGGERCEELWEASARALAIGSRDAPADGM